SEARSWSIPSEDPYEEAAQQLAGIPKADTLPWNRPLLATPRPGCETARTHYGSWSHCSYVETSLQDTKRRMMAALELVNLRKDRAAVRAEIEVLRSERLAYEQEGIQTREALARSEAYCRALKATRRGQTTPTNPNNPNNMTPKDVQTMINQALLRNSGGRDGSHSSHAENPKNMHTARPCYYADFMKCHPLNFKGTEGAVGLTWWIEKMESVFNISGCAVENQVKFATCILLDATLTWWNSQIRTLGPDAYTMTWSVLKKKMTDKYCPLGEFVSNETEKVDKYIIGLPDNIYRNVKFATCTLLDATLTWWNSQLRTLGPDAYTMTWSVLKKKITDKYCPLGEVKKLEIELWNIKVDKYIIGLPDNIYGNVKSSKPKTLDETIKLANDLMDQKLRTYAERKSDSKRKADDISRNNKQHFKKQNIAKAYNLGSAKKKTYEGNAPKCTKC
nr:hypothetical protein [Tanacetum cinerariifolium]